MSRSGAQAVERSLVVLQVFADSTTDLGITDVAQRTGLSASTAHRLVQALRVGGLLAQDPVSERYHLGPGAATLGRRAEARLGFDRLRPLLDDLAARTGESVSVGTRVGAEVLIVLHVESPQPLRFDQAPGTRVPIHASGIGKAILAFSADPAAEVAALLPLAAITAGTITDPTELVADLARARERGWALNDGERHVGVRTMAAPVADGNGRVWAGLAIQGPTVRLDDARLAELAPELVVTAGRMAAAVA
jgi:IclR family acetate operon transcriptional repressor